MYVLRRSRPINANSSANATGQRMEKSRLFFQTCLCFVPVKGSYCSSGLCPYVVWCLDSLTKSSQRFHRSLPVNAESLWVDFQVGKLAKLLGSHACSFVSMDLTTQATEHPFHMCLRFSRMQMGPGHPGHVVSGMHEGNMYMTKFCRKLSLVGTCMGWMCLPK